MYVAIGEGKYYLTALKAYDGPNDLILEITTSNNTSALVSFTVEVPGYRWSTAASCSYGVFTEVSTPDVVSLDGGERAIIVTPENGESLIIISRNKRSLSDSVVNIQFLPYVENELTYYAISYGCPNYKPNAHTSLIMIVGQSPQTLVSITTVVSDVQMQMEGKAITLEANKPTSIEIKEGETILLSVEKKDLTGTKIETKFPVTFLNGHECSFVPSTIRACDQLAEEIPPVEYWGTEFVAVPTAERQAYDILRILAAFEDTSVTFNCTNGTVSLLELKEREFKDVRLFSHVSCGITATKQVLIMQYCVGYFADLVTGDPFMTLVIPTAWYSNEHFFFTFSQYEHNYINIVIPHSYNLNEIYLDGTTLDNLAIYGHFSTQVGEFWYYALQIPVSPGSHHLYHEQVPAKIGVTVYGLEPAVSYGYASLPLGWFIILLKLFSHRIYKHI